MNPHPILASDRPSRLSRTLFSVVAMIAMIGSGAPLRAQEMGFQREWEALVTPYFWMPWTNVGVKPSDPRIPSSSGTIDFGQLASHLSWVPFMGAAEFRNGPYGVALDYIHAPIRSGLNTRNIVFGGGTSSSTIDTGTALFLYRPYVDPTQYVDVGVGVRVWGIDGDISLNQRLAPAVNLSNGISWADPLIAVRYHRDLGDGFGATFYGDIGGFGLGAHFDWQLIATIDYKLRSSIDLHAGFRSLNFNYSAPRTGLNVNMYGPIIAATFRF